MAAVVLAPSSFSDGTEAIALVVLLTEFAMMRASLSRSQVRLYSFQSLAVSALAVFVAATQHVGDLYVLAGLSFVLKVVVVPRIVLRLLRDSLAGEQIGRLTGIVNGTTNYMLTRMSEEGLGYSEALAEAQALGYAEADPTADVEGFDAAAKAAILAGVAFDADVVVTDVHREGISGLQTSDIEFAHRLGYEVKLLAIVERVRSPDSGGPGVAVRVHPAMVPKDHPLSSVRGPFNAVFVEGDAVGELMVYGRGAGGKPTASAVLGDVIDAAHHLREGSRGRSSLRHPVDLRPITELYSQYYLTLDVADRPGVLAAVASVFGQHRVSIRSMEQIGLAGEARLVFITHTALEADLQATLRELARLEAVERIGSVLRVIGDESLPSRAK